MGLSTNIPQSRRMYLSDDELKQFANITIQDDDEAHDVISQAEEIIDAYIKRTYQDKFIPHEVDGLATGGTTTTIIDTSGDTKLHYDDNYWKWCEVEILGGTNEGEIRRIVSSSKDDRSLTVDEAFPSAIDDTSFFVIRQIGLFPRIDDVIHKNRTYYKRIPEAVRRATAAQVEYIIEKGDGFFKGGAEFQSESIDDYSYQLGKGHDSLKRMIAPKARMFLKGYRNRTGRLIRPNPTKL